MSYRSVFVLTGAGISAESGVPTFRASDGLWEGHPVSEVATPEGFRRDPKLVHEFYNARRAHLKQVEPNPAHRALAEFEKKFEGDFLLVTQNVDDLHERAGSKKLLHMHGELLKARCLKSGEIRDCAEDLDWRGTYRPHIVWFGEMPLYMDVIERALSNCDLFISIGTSGAVYPAAGFVAAVPDGCRTVEINLGDTEIAPLFKERRVGKAGDEVPSFLNSLFSK